MKNKRKIIKLQCVFCRSTAFKMPYESYEPQIGELVQCANCSQLNDFESIYYLAINYEVDEVSKNIVKNFNKQLTKMLGKSRCKIFHDVLVKIYHHEYLQKSC